ncbi:CCCH-type zinc finger protein [Phanerochaete sordida]|uniref:CCCH-type zinc finger protein n=1 Tax=Phanerochaete sordida TaxID=48140 RepID=A0A9P3FZG6_9APHY|nr:CCCH-type zinc finger protein [Phanerochaete sordida]
MDDLEDGSATTEYDQWERLLNEQTGLFRRTTTRNKELAAKVEELEREVSVWKIAHKAVEDEKNNLNKAVSKLERNIGSLKEDNPLILCLIDGDGNIFSPLLIREGLAGGRHAAKLLTQGLTEHMASLDLSLGRPSGRGEIWLTIYCNKKGLTETLIANEICTAEQFDQFIMGFNQAAPLFSFVDAGVGKEAADSKIKECLRVFTRFPQTSRVFFGGAHDNGYTSTLNYLANEGLHHKLTILRGYRDFAPEVKSLNLPFLDIHGLFMTEKIPTNNFKKQPNMQSNHINPVQPLDFDKFKTKTSPALQSQDIPGSPGKKTEKGRRPTPGLPLHKHRPPPCNFFYLANCKHGDKCRYAHDYIVTPEHIAELRKNAKKWPCPELNRNHPCLMGNDCPMAHHCPHGPKCIYAKTGKCKFSKFMHGAPKASPNDTTEASTAARSPSPASTTNPYADTPLSPSDSAYDDVPVAPFGAPPGLPKPPAMAKSRSRSP